MHNKRWLPVLLAGWMAMAASAGEVRPVNGAAYREIVVAADAPSMTKLAACELQKHLALTAGVTIPIVENGVGSGARPVIVVGAGPLAAQLGVTADNLPPEGYRIVSAPDYLGIVGRDHTGEPISLPVNPWRPLEVWNAGLGLDAFGEAGTLYGVNHFLENVAGVRWYWPGPDGMVIRETDLLEVPLFTEEDAPKFHYRYPWFCLGEMDGEQLLWLRRANFGGLVPVYIIHSYHHFQKYKDSHPEYFALVDGKRDFTTACAIGGGGHLCLTNPAVIDQWIKDIREWFDANPDQRVYPLVPMDGLTRVCGCPACQAEIDYDLPRPAQFSNHIWGFVNKVAAEVIKTHPDRFIGCLSYESYSEPPSRIEKLQPNVIMMLCYARAFTAVPKEREAVRSRLEEWRGRTSNIYTWNWYLEHWGAWKGLPIATPELYRDEYRYLDSLGVWKGEFIEAENSAPTLEEMSRMGHPAMQHLNLYITGRALWNPDFDLDTVLDEYYRLFYGPAEEPMRRFWETASASFMAAAAEVGDNGKSTLVPEDAYPAAVLSQLDECLTQAEGMAPADSAYLRRIAQVRKEFDPAREALTQFIRQGSQKFSIPQVATPEELDAAANPQRFVARDGSPPPEQTWFAAGYDDRNLYLKFVCFESQMEQLQAIRSERDAFGIWEEDTIEIFLSPDPANAEYCFQFIINANGAVWDAQHGFGGIASTEWNAPGAAAKGSKEENRWILDVTIPLADLGIRDPAQLRQFTGNFYRGRTIGGELVYSCWSPTFTPANYAPNRFGTLNFDRK